MNADRLEMLYTSIIHDVLRAQEMGHQILPYDIRPLTDGLVVGGAAFPVSGRLDSTISADDSLLAWTDLLSVAPKDSVVVLDANDDNYAHMGELSAETLKGRGVRGFVTNGGTRDVKVVREIGFPVWCCYATPSDIVGRWTIDTIGEPITIGASKIELGDWVLADDDGVAVIAANIAEDVVAEAERLVTSEDLVRTAIRGGMSPKDAYIKYRKF